MDKFAALSKGQKLLLGGGVLLFIDTFLPWQSVSIGPVSATADAWHGFWGVLLSLMVIVLLAWWALRVFGIALPTGIPEGLSTLALGGLILLFAVIKTLNDSFRGWASWVGIVLAAVVAFGAWLTFQDSGEVLPRVAAEPPTDRDAS